MAPFCPLSTVYKARLIYLQFSISSSRLEVDAVLFIYGMAHEHFRAHMIQDKVIVRYEERDRLLLPVGCSFIKNHKSKLLHSSSQHPNDEYKIMGVVLSRGYYKEAHGSISKDASL